jgi:phage shock protein A
MDQHTDDRLQRIEDKLDKMSDAIVALARVEEKITDLEVRRAEGHERLNRMSGKMDDIDGIVISLRERMSVMTKIMWLVGAGVISSLMTHLPEIM